MSDANTISLWGEPLPINPADIAAGVYLTRTQTLRAIEEQLNLTRADAAAELARGCAAWRLPCWWEDQRDTNRDLPMSQARRDLPPHDLDYWLTTPTDPDDPDRVREATWDTLVDGLAIPARHESECRYRKPLFLRSSVDEFIAEVRRDKFKRASDHEIRLVLQAIHTEARRSGRHPPNVVKVLRLVQERLAQQYRYASQPAIREIAGEPSFASERATAGRPPTIGQ